MEHEDSPASGPAQGRAYSPLYRGSALVVLLIFFFGGGWAVFSPTERAHAMGTYAREAISASLPEARRILGMLALDRDIEDFREYADRKDPAGNFYREEAGISLEMRPLRGRYEKAFASAYAALSGTLAVNAAIGLGPGKRKPPYIAAPEEVWFPLKSDLHLSHPYALDVFFQHVDKNGEAERGPRIRSLYPGIVVAAASDWTGGSGAAAYSGGGLSPASGNGVVIYDPASRLYCSYFHLSSVTVRRGDLVLAGEILGRGGNSGMNARTAGHGEHIHIEIFDAARDGPLSSYEILELLKK